MGNHSVCIQGPVVGTRRSLPQDTSFSQSSRRMPTLMKSLLLTSLLCLGCVSATAQPTPLCEYRLHHWRYLVRPTDSTDVIRRVYPKTDKGYPFFDFPVREGVLPASGFLQYPIPVSREQQGRVLTDSLVVVGTMTYYRSIPTEQDTLIAGYGQYVDGAPHGTWVWLYENKQPSAVENYREGVVRAVQYYKPDGSLEQPDHIGERDPEPINMKTVFSRISRPTDLVEGGFRGKVVIRLLVGVDGNYVRHYVVRSPHPRLTSIVAAQLPKLRFKPAIYHNQPSAVWLLIPFQF